MFFDIGKKMPLAGGKHPKHCIIYIDEKTGRIFNKKPMYTTKNIEYFKAKHFFSDAEIRGQKLILGNIDTNIWLHKEKINFDYVVEIAKRYNDSCIFIISNGPNRGFYIYSNSQKVCFKLVNESLTINHVEMV